MKNILRALHLAADPQQAAGHDHLSEALHDLGPDDHIDDTGLVLNGHEHHTLGGARPLAHQHQTRGLDAPAILGRCHFDGREQPPSPEILSEKGHRMGF